MGTRYSGVKVRRSFLAAARSELSGPKLVTTTRPPSPVFFSRQRSYVPSLSLSFVGTYVHNLGLYQLGKLVCAVCHGESIFFPTGIYACASRIWSLFYLNMSINLNTDALLARAQQAMDTINAIADYRNDHGTSVRSKDLDAMKANLRQYVAAVSEIEDSMYSSNPPSMSHASPVIIVELHQLRGDIAELQEQNDDWEEENDSLEKGYARLERRVMPGWRKGSPE